MYVSPEYLAAFPNHLADRIICTTRMYRDLVNYDMDMYETPT